MAEALTRDSCWWPARDALSKLHEDRPMRFAVDAVRRRDDKKQAQQWTSLIDERVNIV